MVWESSFAGGVCSNADNRSRLASGDWSNHGSGYSREPKTPNGPLSDGAPRLNLVPGANKSRKGLDGENMMKLLRRLWEQEEGQDIAEYAVMLAVILVIVVGTIRLIGGNANNVFSSVSSSIGS
jgi:Flp pilus assembly pilin Flp